MMRFVWGYLPSAAQRIFGLYYSGMRPFLTTDDRYDS